MKVLLLALILLLPLVFTENDFSAAFDGIMDGAMDGYYRHQYPVLSRQRRYLETAKQRRCGSKLMEAVTAACQRGCEPGSGVSLSTLCCSETCNYQDIRSVCCIEKF
ncbi:hypothetical protein GCK72_025214 [Caenorhabditis remanei]|uniref:Uncharacterized protein n=1 Tax=Caenorhabditis remanei TaxID=31234 RepID=A0A6A5G1B0_CAERE|nr:hypothetical protein GCK72_025214 [Caenorhabditis remanei]KAF1748747.1 hypothetical protein GCK72_025214 [Caenorhabditis remanei]